MTRLKPPDIHHVRATQGWLELGSHTGALEELEKVDAKFLSHPEVLEVRWAVNAAVKRWEDCIRIAGLLIEAAPASASGWIHRSFALHELKRTKEAADLLMPAVKRFPKVSVIRYNLACYVCQLGNSQEAREWLEQAMEIGDAKEIKFMALDDPDLEPMWREIGGI